MATSTSDIVILAVGIVLAALYLFKDTLFAAKEKTAPVVTRSAGVSGGENPRDFVQKMKAGVRVSYHYLTSQL